MKLGILASHPVQYHVPLFRHLARTLDLHVYFAHQQTAQGQANAGFGIPFNWDVDLFSGYAHSFLANRARRPGTDHFAGCDTPEIAQTIEHEKFDGFIVIGWALKSYWQAIRACCRSGTPVFVRGDSQLGMQPSRLKRAVKQVTHRWIVRQFDGFLIVGQRARAYLLHYGASPARMYSSPHFVDNDAFRLGASRADRRSTRARLGIKADTLVLLFVGKFIAKKRPLDLLHAAAALSKRGVQTECLFVGAGELDSEIRSVASGLGVSAHCVGFKNQSELPEFYAAADALVLPSDGGETWGLVVNEGIACGLPAFVSDAVGCGPDLVEPGLTGDIFPLGNTSALAECLQRFHPRFGSHDVRDALRRKINQYSVEAAAAGVIAALNAHAFAKEISPA